MDRFILLTRPAMSCLEYVINKDEFYVTINMMNKNYASSIVAVENR